MKAMKASKNDSRRARADRRAHADRKRAKATRAANARWHPVQPLPEHMLAISDEHLDVADREIERITGA